MTAVSSLTPYARNARTHSDEQVAQIAASIKEWGWTVPVLIDDENTLIAGHGRLLAAQRLGLSEVPAMKAGGWSDAQKQAYILADNQLPQNAGWDTELLKIELEDLTESGFELGVIGFDPDYLSSVMFGAELGGPPGVSVTNEDKHIILVELDSESKCAELYAELDQRGLECKIMS